MEAHADEEGRSLPDDAVRARAVEDMQRLLADTAAAVGARVVEDMRSVFGDAMATGRARLDEDMGSLVAEAGATDSARILQWLCGLVKEECTLGMHPKGLVWEDTVDSVRFRAKYGVRIVHECTISLTEDGVHPEHEAVDLIARAIRAHLIEHEGLRDTFDGLVVVAYLQFVAVEGDAGNNGSGGGGVGGGGGSYSVRLTHVCVPECATM